MTALRAMVVALITAHNPIDRADTGQLLLRAHPFGLQLLADLPREYLRVEPLVLLDFLDHVGCGNLWFTAAD